MAMSADQWSLCTIDPPDSPPGDAQPAFDLLYRGRPSRNRSAAREMKALAAAGRT